MYEKLSRLSGRYCSKFCDNFVLARTMYSLRNIRVYPVITGHLRLSLQQFSNVKLTSKQYPQLKRGQYSQVTESSVKVFEAIVGKDRIITDAFELEAHNTDWMKMYRGMSKLMLKPRTTEEVSEILKYCSKENLAVCPQGGNTGLVGGSVPVFDEVILNMSLMNNIIHMDKLTGVLQCQSGCILEVIEEYANQFGYIIPLDLGAKGSCQIGGNIATNAGGLRFLRYGSLHGNVLGLEVVLASGEILDCMSTLRKDNTGYDLKQIFIGSEGTLGVITKVAIQCASKPNSVIVAFLGCSSFENVLKTYETAKQMLSEVLSSFEMMDHDALEPVEKYMNTKIPISHRPFYMLIEVSGSDAKHDEEKISAFLQKLIADDTVKDGTLATSPSQVKQLWSVREFISTALQKEGSVYKYDISLPLKDYYRVVVKLRQLHGHRCIRCCGFGHIGDGNLHLNITSETRNEDLLQDIDEFTNDFIISAKGSFSAEHGIGLKKCHLLPKIKTPTVMKMMENLKLKFDPNKIMNPYKLNIPVFM